MVGCKLRASRGREGNSGGGTGVNDDLESSHLNAGQNADVEAYGGSHEGQAMDYIP